MPTSHSLISRCLCSLFNSPPAPRSRRRPPLRRASRFGFETLERRDAFSVTLGSALSIGLDDINLTWAGDVQADSAGNSYVTGGFSGTVDFDPGDGVVLRTALGYEDPYVAKYTPDGSLVWVTQFGDALDGSSERGVDLAVGTDGSVYVTGRFYETIQIGTTTFTSAGGSDAFLAKLDSSGTIQWGKTWGTASTEIGWSVDLDAANNVYVSSTSESVLIQKFRPTGAPLWSRVVNTNNFGTGSEASLDVDAAGNVVIVGNYRYTVDFDPSAKQKLVYGNAYSSAFVLKLNEAGKFQWVSTFFNQYSPGVYSSATASQVKLDGANNVIVSGYYWGSPDFNPGAGVATLPVASTDGSTAYIAKLNPSGGFVWARALEREALVAYADDASIYGLAVDSQGSVYAVGGFSGTIDFDPSSGTAWRTSTSTSTKQIFALKLTSSGAFDWVETFGGPDGATGYANAVAVDSTGTIHIVGLFRGAIDFDPDPLATKNLPSGAKASGFLLRLRQS